MKLHTVLLAGFLALTGTALRAEEFQMAIHGVACPQGSIFCDPSLPTTVPVTITGDLNSVQGMVTPSGVLGPSIDTLTGSAPLTNYTEIVGGKTLAFDASSSLSFNCFISFSPSTYECNGGFGGVGFNDNETWMATVTPAQFQAFKDPLASLLLMNPATVCSNGGISDFCSAPFGMVAGTVTFTVPAPGPLSLFLAGVVGLALSRYRKQASLQPPQAT